MPNLQEIIDYGSSILEADIPFDAPRNYHEIFSLIDNVRCLIISELSNGYGGVKPRQEISISNIILCAEFGIMFLQKIDIEKIIEELKPYFEECYIEAKKREDNPQLPFSFLAKSDLEIAERNYKELDNDLKEFYSNTLEFFKIVKDIQEVK